MMWVLRLRGAWTLLRRIEAGLLLAASVAHYLLFWVILLMFEAPDAKIIEPINYWYYWATTVLTIGYGDLSPGAPVSRLFAPIFEFVGVLIFAAVLTKAGIWLSDQSSKRRRGLMPTHAKGHIVILGDWDPARTPALVRNILFDREDDGERSYIVGCFRNTGDRNPFERLASLFKGNLPEYIQANGSGFSREVLGSANVEQASQIYIALEDDAAAIGMVCGLSRLAIKAPVVLMVRDRAISDLLPPVSFDLRIIYPIQATLAVREMEDPGTAQALEHLSDVSVGEAIYSLPVTVQNGTEFLKVGDVFTRMFGDEALLLGFANRRGGSHIPHIRPPKTEVVGNGDRVLYIADRDFSDEQVRAFNLALAA